MNKTVELLNLWADFESKHTSAEIEDFCRYMLIKEREKENIFSDVALPPDNLSKLAKITGRVSKLHNTYAVIALKECGLSSIDEFVYLSDIHFMDKSQKTKVIYSNFNELSSGLLILERLKKKKLISEEDNSNDKRSKNISITAKGKKILFSCYEKMNTVNQLFFNKMSIDDVIMSIQLLSATEVEFSKRWLNDKSKSFDELS
ncbi:MAG TPA: hypothetical protein PLC76_03520 [Saprospiraceae bacterium]|jgi:predicted transcriptional regulator|nr:MAG: hypothetical protein HWD63_14005 [Candidatus Parvibacillus calidus]HRN33166.1 hypothetical protein [Saprospiraceae bacterium]HRP83766.1 hypothetical protein [Saprospiraceae bacterium]